MCSYIEAFSTNTQDARRTLLPEQEAIQKDLIITPKFQPQSSSQLLLQEGGWSRLGKGRMLRLVLEQGRLCLNTQMSDPHAPVCLIFGHVS